jgi:CheY-like chemotaxis protein
VETDLPDADGPVVLVADDEPALRALFGRALGRDRIRCLLAANGREAMDLLASNRVDVVLLDLNMPVLGGLGTLHEIRADPRLRSMPVILVTGSDVEAAELRDLDDQADVYLAKPVTLDALSAHVRALLDRGPA